jgi:hypothetical protein
MISRLIWVTLITSFASGTRRPHEAVVVRLGIATAITLLLGIAAANSLRQAGLPSDLPGPWLRAVVLLAGFALTGIVFMAIGGPRAQRSVWERLVTTWPVSALVRSSLRLLPAGLALSLVWLFALPVLASLNLPGANLAFVLGAAIAAWLVTRGHPAAITSLIFLAVVVGSIQLLVHRHEQLVVWLVTAAGLMAALSPQRWPAGPTLHLALPARPLNQWWFVLKLLRNRRTLTALSFGCILTTVSAGFIEWRHLTALGGAGWFMLSAIMSATIACDLRGLSARHKAPEVEALGGLAYFVRSQLRAALPVAIMPALPIAIITSLHSPGSQTVAYAVSLQLAATLLGLVAGTLLVPGDKDMGSQLFAAVLSTSAIIGVPKLLTYASLAQLTITWSGIAASAIILIYLIEINRRRSYAPIRT